MGKVCGKNKEYDTNINRSESKRIFKNGITGLWRRFLSYLT